MAKTKAVTFSRFPYISINISIPKRDFNVEALLDTGYDGGIVLPPKLITNGEVSKWLVNCKLADDSIVEVGLYWFS